MELKYRSDIDGLRAFAVLAVIIYHLNHHWLHGGFAGVDIFFVISGYLITKIIFSEISNNNFSFKTFYQRRINRILPVFFCVMLVTSVLSWCILLPEDFMLFLRALKSTTYFWENMFFAKNTVGYWDTSAESIPILHTWSLAVEEQFYIILPLILILLFKFKHLSSTKAIIITLTFISIISFLLAQFSPKSILLTKYNYYSLFTGRAGELLIGSILGILSYNRDRNPIIASGNSHKKPLLFKHNLISIIGFLSIISSVIFISDKLLFPSVWALLPTIGTGLILYFYHPQSLIARLLSLKPIVFIGKISYSLYLWHWPVIVLTRKFLFIEEFYKAKHYILVVIITLIFSLLSYYFVERPCRLKKRSFKFSFICYYLLPTLIIFSVYYTQKHTGFLNNQNKKILELYNLQREYLDSSKNYCMGKINGTCVFGDTTKQPKILLIGDSHAGHYSPYIDEAGKKYGFAVKIITSEGCTFLPEQFKLNIFYPEFKDNCTRMNNVVKKEMNNVNIIIYAGRYDAYNYNNRKGQLQYLIANYLPINIPKFRKKVIVLAQVPWIDTSEHEKFMVYFLHNKRYKFNSKNFITGQEKIPNELIEKGIFGKAIFFDPLKDLDEKSKKEWPVYRGLLAYSHDGHLGEYVTRQWSQEVLPKQYDFWTQLANEANQ